MAKIVAGRFGTVDDARAAASLVGRGVARDDIDVLFNNPVGHHARFPIGGDEDADPHAREGAQLELRRVPSAAQAHGEDRPRPSQAAAHDSPRPH